MFSAQPPIRPFEGFETVSSGLLAPNSSHHLNKAGCLEDQAHLRGERQCLEVKPMGVKSESWDLKPQCDGHLEVDLWGLSPGPPLSSSLTSLSEVGPPINAVPNS